MTDSIGERFMVESRYENMGETAQSRGVPQPPLELPWDEKAELISLPAPAEIHLPGSDLRTMIEQRMTIRAYSDKALSKVELAYLLWCTQGVKAKTERPVLSRTVPSAGARHPFETYLLINKVEDLQPGLYRYISTRHALIAMNLQGKHRGNDRARLPGSETCTAKCGHLSLGCGGGADLLAVWPARLSLYAPGCRARLPEPLPGCRIHRLRGLRHRRIQ